MYVYISPEGMVYISLFFVHFYYLSEYAIQHSSGAVMV